MKRLVIGPNWLGDAVMAIPVLRAIRSARPDDRLSVLAPRGPAAIFRAEGSADEVLARSSFPADVAALRRGGFDEALLLPRSFRAGLYAYLSGAPRRIGYATDGRAGLLTEPLPPPPDTSHQLRDYDALLNAIGVAPDTDPPRLTIPPAARVRAEAALAAADVPSDAPLVLLCPGSARDETKRWPAGRFTGLGDRLAQRRFSCAIAVGPGERELGARVSRGASAPLPVVGDDLDPVGLAALFSQARLVVSNDSGPMHLAAAVGTPVVALFGPTDPGRTGPSGSRSRVLDRYVFCSPCYLSRCPYGHECMKEIGVDDVLRACVELAGEASADPSLRSG